MKEMYSDKLRSMEAAGRDIATSINSVFDKFHQGSGYEKWRFALMIFSLNGPESACIGNARRADMVKAMQEFINRNSPNQASAADEAMNDWNHCDHEWELRAGDCAPGYELVKCAKCGCPGERQTGTDDVFWPAR